MAGRVGIGGLANTGKTTSSRNVPGEETFVISPNSKTIMMNMKDKSTLPTAELYIEKDGKLTNQEGICKATDMKETEWSTKDIGKIIYYYKKKKLPLSLLNIKGHKTMTEYVTSVNDIMEIIDKKRPDILNIYLSDFTHFVTRELADEEFLNMNTGNAAFQRYLLLAANLINNVVQNIDLLRENILVITEYHLEYDEEKGLWTVCTPGGKMLIDKFQLESYYEYMFFTHYEENEKKFEDRFKFVTRREGKYNARSCGIFGNKVYMPNDLQPILLEIRKKLGL